MGDNEIRRFYNMNYVKIGKYSNLDPEKILFEIRLKMKMNSKSPKNLIQ